MSKRDLILIIFVAGAIGFIGGLIGGALTGDIHIYIDSFTGPGHIAGELTTDGIAAPDMPGD